MALRWPDGVRSGIAACGIKPQGPDLGLLVFDEPASWAGAFTQNAAAAAPVIWSRSRLGTAVKALVVNSGNANACTGTAGSAAVARTTELTASLVAAQREQVLVASTGPIGITLPVEQVCSGITGAHASLGTDVEPFAASILTTDSCPKLATERAGDGMTIGVAKGAAMIAPNMATMLAFIVTDVQAPSELLQELLGRAVSRSFNRISIDACESTNDSVFLFSTGRGRAATAQLEDGLTKVCESLAEQIVRDAEGGTRLVRIRIEGAASEDVAARLGHAVAASALWRAAVGGADPNWGRVLAALGSVERSLDMDRLQVAIGDETVFGAGGPRGDNRKAATAMRADEFTITCTLSEGNGSAEVLCPDLSSDYVLLNAGGTT